MKIHRNASYSYMANMIAAFAHHFQSNNLPDITKEKAFKEYKKGLSRDLKGESFPNAKAPITTEILQLICQQIDEDDHLQLRDIAMYSLMFYGFLRFNECVALTQENLTIYIEGKLRIEIKSSKTDPNGKGAFVFINSRDTSYCAVRWYRRYRDKCLSNKNEISFAMSQPTFRKRLHTYMRRIALPEDIEKYSGHSFRRGGAASAAINGVQDSHIKVHGRWKSHVYTRYTTCDMLNAGAIFTVAI